MSSLQVTVIDSLIGWQKLAPDWNALLEQSGSGSVFLTWEWLASWAQCCLREERALFILVLREKGGLAGVAPFYIEHRRRGPFTLREIRFLGTPEGGSDYLDVIARRGLEKEVADAIYDFLTGDGAGTWDLLSLQDIPADALFLVHFDRRLQAEGKYAELRRSSYCPAVRLPRTEEEYLSLLSPWRRKRFRQDHRTFQRQQPVVHSVITGRDVVGKLDDFFRLYEEKGGWSGQEVRGILEGFLDRSRGREAVQIDSVTAEGRPIAALLHLRYRDVLSLYLMAVDKGFNPKISLGNLVVGSCILNSIAAGYATYDFLKGEEPYKFHWSTGGRSGMQLLFWQKRPAAVASGIGRLARHAGKLLLR